MRGSRNTIGFSILFHLLKQEPDICSSLWLLLLSLPLNKVFLDPTQLYSRFFPVPSMTTIDRSLESVSESEGANDWKLDLTSQIVDSQCKVRNIRIRNISFLFAPLLSLMLAANSFLLVQRPRTRHEIRFDARKSFTFFCLSGILLDPVSHRSCCASFSRVPWCCHQYMYSSCVLFLFSPWHPFASSQKLFPDSWEASEASS